MPLVHRKTLARLLAAIAPALSALVVLMRANAAWARELPSIDTMLSTGLSTGLSAGLSSGLSGIDAITSGWKLGSCAGQGVLGSLWGGLGNAMWAPPGQTVGGCGSSVLLDLGFLAILVIAVIVVVRIRHHTERGRLELARRFIEQGIEPPESLFPSAARADLRRGIVLTAAGAGMLIASNVASASSTALATLGPAGLIPGFIGLGYLVSYTVSRLTARGK